MRLLLGCVLLAAAVACGDNSLQPLPLDVKLEASPATAAPGDTINFLVRAQGGSLVGIDMDFGDNTADAFGTAGARTAIVTFRHAFLTTGNFLVRATVTDALAGQKDATVQVQVP